MGDVDGFAGGTMKGAGARAGCAMSGVMGATIGVAGGMMGRAELGGAAVEALATAVREMLSRRIDGGALSALISEPWPSPRWRGVNNVIEEFRLFAEFAFRSPGDCHTHQIGCPRPSSR